MRLRLLVVAAVLLLSSAPARADPTPISGRVTERETGDPVEDVTVYITGGAGTEQIVQTDVDGRYTARVAGDGTYAIVFAYGGLKRRQLVTVDPGRALTVDLAIDLTPGEVIVLTERVLPPVPPTPTRPRRSPPPYSDAAIERDVWAVAWLLLDIDARGVVTRVKWLNRPGHDLAPIALREAFAQRFRPARDAADRPVPSRLVWSLEWQAYWWLVYRAGVTTGYLNASAVPCRGSGPMNLDSQHPIYRDCTPPDLTKIRTERWITSPD